MLKAAFEALKKPVLYIKGLGSYYKFPILLNIL